MSATVGAACTGAGEGSWGFVSGGRCAATGGGCWVTTCWVTGVDGGFCCWVWVVGAAETVGAWTRVVTGGWFVRVAIFCGTGLGGGALTRALRVGGVIVEGCWVCGAGGPDDGAVAVVFSVSVAGGAAL